MTVTVDAVGLKCEDFWHFALGVFSLCTSVQVSVRDRQQAKLLLAAIYEISETFCTHSRISAHQTKESLRFDLIHSATAPVCTIEMLVPV